MADLSLKRLVLYKSGIGYFVREGDLDGDTLTLTFSQDEVNDVLKSLSVLDYAGGQVVGIHYDTPVDTAVKLANNTIRLSEVESLKTLLRDLRGRQIQAQFEAKFNQTETITGQLIGIDVDEAITRLSILREDQQIRVYKLDDLRELRILDEQSQSDLVDFLESNKSESDRRTITVQLSEGQHELSVSYVAPSPNWRVSYRVIAESDEGKTQGKAVLLGWGLFDNHMEDLDEVHVTLVAGNPISFQYDLYSSNVPERERIQDQIGGIQGHVAYDAPAPQPQKPVAPMPENAPQKIQYGQSKKSGAGGLASGIADGVSSMVRRRDSNKQKPQRSIGTQAMRLSVGVSEEVERLQAQIEGRNLGEMFQYVVTQPVTVKRGVSALVPIINQSEMNYTRELLYNFGKVPNHPVVALRMKNATGFTLERGPVTVVEDGDYKGEAVIPFTRDEGELYLPYAVERGVKVSREVKSRSEQGSIYIQGVELLDEIYYHDDTAYTIENNTNTDKVIRIEQNKKRNYDLIDSPDPEEETPEFRRWSVTVQANRSVEFKVQERRLIERTQIIAGGCNPFRRIIARIYPLFRPELRRHVRR